MNRDAPFAMHGDFTMSYSRWSNSTWYTFWSAGDATTKEDEVLSLWLSIDSAKDWTYNELKTWTVETVLENYPDITQAEAEEALEYIQHFLTDVEKEYEHKSQPETKH